MQHIGPDVSGRRRKPNGQFDNEFATLAKGPDPLAYERNKVRDWGDLDMPDYEIREWKKARFSADDAYAWGYGGGCGFTPEQAREWRRVGIYNPYMADQWSSYGFEPRDAVEWAGHGFISVEDDHPELWRDAGFSDPADAGAWHKAGFNHAQALSWKEARLSLADAELNMKLKGKTTKNRFHHTPAMYTKHSPKEIQLLEADSDYEIPYGLYGSKDWKRLGFSPDAAHAWQSVGKDPYQAAELREQLSGK